LTSYVKKTVPELERALRHIQSLKGRSTLQRRVFDFMENKNVMDGVNSKLMALCPVLAAMP